MDADILMKCLTNFWAAQGQEGAMVDLEGIAVHKDATYSFLISRMEEILYPNIQEVEEDFSSNKLHKFLQEEESLISKQ